MAKPVKETPILFGEDARRFEKRMQQKREVSQKEIERVKRNYESIMSILKK
ncbi:MULTISPECIES: hypothetical protein [Bacteroides]|uniref:hypothetical protein n=1 Tax=Bacteroides TaxID=816 RepID=UPI001C8B2C7A|nr:MULTISPECIES: hypothetical protein [Bacteroides]MBX9187770.1 hypothetical protein [Bacteroides sp. K03]